MSKNLRFGIIGTYQTGKSLLINCLLGRHLSTVGRGDGTTHAVVHYIYSREEYVETIDYTGRHETMSVEQLGKAESDKNLVQINVYIDSAFLRAIELVDTPGIGYLDSDNGKALGAIKCLDYAIVVIPNNKELSYEDSLYQNLTFLNRYDIPFYWFLNCVDATKFEKWDTDSEVNRTIYRKNDALLSMFHPENHPYGNVPYRIINLLWYWYSICKDPDNDEILRPYLQYLDGDGLREADIKEVKEASYFYLVQDLFSMNNRAYLELKKELKEHLSRIKDELCPVGTIQTFAFSRIPYDGWLECDGRDVEVADYPELFSAIGFTFGGNDSNKFKLPDLRGRFLRGWDHSAGTDSGRQFGSFQDDCLQEHGHIFETESQSTGKEGYHKHSVYTAYHKVSGLGTTASNWVNDGYDSAYSAKDTNYNGEHSHRLPSMSVKGVQAINDDSIKVDVKESRPKNVAMLFCIKAKNGSGTYAKNSLFEAPCTQTIELKDLHTSDSDNQFEGFIWLEASWFKLIFEGHDIIDRIRIKFIDQNNIEEYHCNNGTCHVNTGGLYFIRYRKAGQHNGLTETELTAKKIESMGIIGSFNQWSRSVKMTQYLFSPLLYTAIINMKAGDTYKFRPNDAWGLGELDGDDYGNLTLHKTKDLVCHQTGEYRVFLDLQRLTVRLEFTK